MNNTIGFSNFRRFTNFPEIELGDVTILVGGNNAGKSTLVKAMLLMRDFLKTRIESINKKENIFHTFTRPQFSFSAEHTNVGDFYRAFCRQSPSKEDTISFTMKIDKFRIVIKIRGERKPGIIPDVTMIAVSDVDRNIHFTFDFSKNQMTALFVNNNGANMSIMEDYPIELQIQHLKSALSKSKDLNEISSLKLRLEQLEKELYARESISPITENESVTIEMSYFTGDNAGKLILPELVKGFAHYSETGTIGDKRYNLYKKQESDKSFLRGKVSEILTVSEELETVLNKQVVEYIYAHSVYQDSVYAKCANSSDYTKRTIHEFYNARISFGDEEFSLVEDWLKEFKIGNSFKVVPYKGDNYCFVIFDDDNPEITSNTRKGYPGGIDLADKGMGSIQLAILLLRLATLIRKHKGQQLTILLEEPEQNLHPALQSKLTELVYSINQKFGLHFIIETHSEYLVRNSQVLVGTYYDTIEKAKDNPFKIYYLPQNGVPYSIGYTLNGRLTEKFETGFFDEAGKANYYLMRKERGLE